MSGIESRIDLNLVARYLLNDNNVTQSMVNTANTEATNAVGAIDAAIDAANAAIAVVNSGIAILGSGTELDDIAGDVNLSAAHTALNQAVTIIMGFEVQTDQQPWLTTIRNTYDFKNLINRTIIEVAGLLIILDSVGANYQTTIDERTTLSSNSISAQVEEEFYLLIPAIGVLQRLMRLVTIQINNLPTILVRQEAARGVTLTLTDANITQYNNRYEDLSVQEYNVMFSANNSYTVDIRTLLNINSSKINDLVESDFLGSTGTGDFGFLKKMINFGSSINDGNFLLSAKTTNADFASQVLGNVQDNSTLNTKFYDYINGDFSIAYWTQLGVSGKKTSTNNENEPLNYTFSMTETSAYTNFYNNKFSLGVGITEQLIPIEFMIKGNLQNNNEIKKRLFNNHNNTDNTTRRRDLVISIDDVDGTNEKIIKYYSTEYFPFQSATINTLVTSSTVDSYYAVNIEFKIERITTQVGGNNLTKLRNGVTFSDAISQGLIHTNSNEGSHSDKLTIPDGELSDLQTLMRGKTSHWGTNCIIKPGDVTISTDTDGHTHISAKIYIKHTITNARNGSNVFTNTNTDTINLNINGNKLVEFKIITYRKVDIYMASATGAPTPDRNNIISVRKEVDDYFREKTVDGKPIEYINIGIDSNNDKYILSLIYKGEHKESNNISGISGTPSINTKALTIGATAQAAALTTNNVTAPNPLLIQIFPDPNRRNPIIKDCVSISLYPFLNRELFLTNLPSTIQLVHDKYYLVTVTKNGDAVKAYINGALGGEMNYQTSGEINQGAIDEFTGLNASTSNCKFRFHNVIGDFRLYNTRLSDVDVMDIFKKTIYNQEDAETAPRLTQSQIGELDQLLKVRYLLNDIPSEDLTNNREIEDISLNRINAVLKEGATAVALDTVKPGNDRPFLNLANANNYIDLQTSNFNYYKTIFNTNNFSICLCFKLENSKTLLEFGPSTAVGVPYIKIMSDASNNLELYINNHSSDIQSFSISSLAANNYYFICLNKYNGLEEIYISKLYNYSSASIANDEPNVDINYTLPTISTTLINNKILSFTNPVNNLRLGEASIIKDFRVYGKALNPSEIRHIVNSIHPSGDAGGQADRLRLEGSPMSLSALISGYEQGAINYNSSINLRNNLHDNQDKVRDEIDEKLKDKYKEDTYKRGAQLLSQKINFNKIWVSRLYFTIRVIYVILAILIVLMIVYKLVNKYQPNLISNNI